MNNKGFTLVELIVASLVATIVIASIVTYGMIGVQNFKSAKSETSAQNETEIVVMAMRDRIKTAKDFRVYSSDNIRALELLYGDDSESGYTTYDCAFIYSISDTDMYIVTNGESDSMSIDIESIDLESLKRSNLVSRYITDFQISPNKLNECENGIIDIIIQSSVGNQTYQQSFKVKLRNY